MIIKIMLTILWLMYMFYRTKKSLHMLQQNLYDDDYRYIKWIKNNFDKILFFLSPNIKNFSLIKFSNVTVIMQIKYAFIIYLLLTLL